MKEWAEKLGRWGLRFVRTWPWFLGTIVIGHLAKENFPFSNWPMYGNFHPNAYYVYIADASGQAIGATTFQENTPRIGRQYAFEKKTAIREAKASGRDVPVEQSEWDAGVKMLKRLANRLTPEQQRQFQGLQLVEMRLEIGPERKILSHRKIHGKIQLEPTAN